MTELIDTTVLDYKEPSAPETIPATQLDNIFGAFPRVTTTPSWTPRFFKDTIAIDTSTNKIWYYDETNNQWRSSATTTNGFEIKVIDDTTTLTTGDNKMKICIPAHMNGLSLTAAHAFVTTASSSGTPTIAIRNTTNGNVDMLSTNITIDANEYTSYTAATPPVINTSNDNVATGDIIAIDCDAAGNSAKGLGVILIFA